MSLLDAEDDNGVGLKKEASKNVFGWFTRFETSNC